MKAGHVGPDDDARVRRLREYELLDTAAEPALDAIVKLAATLLEVPIALISLVDSDRQWFKARHGLTATGTARDISFCGHVVAADAPVVVTDARLDERFVDNPLVTGDPWVRFYAGVPLRAHDGQVLGTLCVIDREPRTIGPGQLDLLTLLAGQVMALLELRRVAHQLRDERQAMIVREAELADRERQLQSVFDGMVEGVVVHDRSGAILQHNPAAATILGLTSAQLQGRSSVDPRWRATHADGRPFPGADHPAMVTLRTGQPQSDVSMCVHQPDGQQRWLAINSRPLIEPGEREPYAVVATFRDVTEPRALAERLARHQRLVTTGTLAAGIGHEINNPLTSVLTNLSLAIEELTAITDATASSRLTEIVGLLEDARGGADRVRSIVRGLKSLTREPTDLVPTDVNAAVHTAVQMATHEVRPRAVVLLELGETGDVMADESRLVQLLVNLIVNAAQGFERPDPSHNLIVVRTRLDRAVAIDVTDNGPGLAPELVAQVFDPFFTARPAAGATGGPSLGLAMAHGIVTALGGEIACESAVGRGTTFRVRLPRVAPATDAAPAAAPGRGRIVVIDDERTILRSIARLLGGEAEVVTFDDPRDALRFLAAGEEVDVVFCDLLMPFLSGAELFDAVVSTRPELAERFVFVSGDMTRADLRAFLARIPNERVEKPFSIQNLRGMARRFIRSRG